MEDHGAAAYATSSMGSNYVSNYSSNSVNGGVNPRGREFSSDHVLVVHWGGTAQRSTSDFTPANEGGRERIDEATQ
jgi:hypothetical protein